MLLLLLRIRREEAVVFNKAMSRSSNDVLEDKVSHLLGLLESHQWTCFRSTALPNPIYFKALTNLIAQMPQLNGMNLLHAALRYNPPAELILEMLEICPALLKGTDSLGRTPLHVAAGSGVTKPDLIKYLANIYPAACDIQDIDGKTPLHLACDSSCELFEVEDDNDTTNELLRGPPCHDTIRALLSESLAAATIEDVDEMNALEYAIMSNAKLKTVKLLQNAATKHFRVTYDSAPTESSPTTPRRISENNTI